ncbi:arsenical pump-driving ATPase [Rossellomorea aquimaris]|uniref:Arsenical pump-driving ATPase n=1 Tax=Rossellomorea aquimaris TaxID=189382 RepID=A0A5D4UCD7_9BACI|nr:arsenical pump-driving ATPase [Rossellomorea aquimaris]TYS78993.1 arsenical pump-driving ATPase [Rossellomorea aquimaris]TYS84738.1 arsenical pump-driving ATPase [Rossellomorea aquimaris]
MLTSFQLDAVNHTPFLFFTGKGGVGKTSTASATAIALADEGKRVLIVSTDPASNLQDVLETDLTNQPKQVPGLPTLFACNLDPEEAAASYREKVIGPYRGKLPDAVVSNMEEQLSGACTVEIAAFDEFTDLLADPAIVDQFDHIVFDTAPTGHTLRLLQLPAAWTGFLEDSTHGASCLGPLSGLGDKMDLYSSTVNVLSDKEKTTLVLVARPDSSSLTEADRASKELQDIGIINQMLIVNGLMGMHQWDDRIASAFYNRQQEALRSMPISLKEIQTYSLPYVAYSLIGTNSLRQLFSQVEVNSNAETVIDDESIEIPGLKEVIDDFSKNNSRVIFTMGKGGVGKTTVASAIAVGLVERGHKVHLTTTDPAAHLTHMFQEEPGKIDLRISRIDPKEAVESYKKSVLSKAAESLDEEGRAYLEEDLNSPCTEEIAIFRSFAEIVGNADEEIVVIDTAPTGHTLLLLDTTESYTKEVSRSKGEVEEHVKNLLPRLRNPNETSVVIVTLPEATPVYEAKRLQEDLHRAEIHPKWWVINQSLSVTNTTDPVLRGRSVSEREWIQKVHNDYANKTALIPWMSEEKIGYKKLMDFSK